MKKPALALLIALGACEAEIPYPSEPEPELKPEVEPEIDTAYAALPLTLTPDSMTVSVGTGIDLQHVENIDSTRIPPYLIEVSNRVPVLRRCGVQQAYKNLKHCAEYEERGYTVLSLEQTELLLVDFGCEPLKRNALPGRIVVRSCFGLTVHERMWDSVKVVFFPEDMDTMFKVIGCGSTWVAYRLKRRVGGGKEVHYPPDALFGDTTHIWSIC